MRTKEQILREVYEINKGDNSHCDLQTCVTLNPSIENIQKAMTEYANEVINEIESNIGNDYAFISRQESWVQHEDFDKLRKLIEDE